jgi:hypothetical protein
MKIYLQNIVCLGVVASMISGCASILNEKTQNINVVTSNGHKTEVSIDGMPFQAPGVASVKRAKSDKIITSKDPKCTQTTVAPSSVDNVFFINILSGGVLGSTTDYATDKMWKYQDTVMVTCRD